MTEHEFAAWWEEHSLRGIFVDVLRRFLSRRLQVLNFRRLALVCGHEMLGPESCWVDAELVVLIRPYTDTDEEAQREWLGAAINGDAAGIVNLLERPLHPDTVERYAQAFEPSPSSTALHFAAKNGRKEIVQCLLEAGAEKDKANSAGGTPLHLAAKYGHPEVVLCLIEAGADKNKADNCGSTPLHLTTECGSKEIALCLLEARADVDKADNRGRTPLHLAARTGKRDIARCLLNADADMGKADCDGTTPLHLAALFGHQQVARCFQGAGAALGKRRRTAK